MGVPTGEPTWLGRADRPLAAWVHTPDSGDAAGVVVLVPSFGREQELAHRSFRRLARDLALAGFAAVRFAWTGSSDSGDLADDDAAADVWVDDLNAVLDEVSTWTDAPVQVVGLRVGALVAGRALSRAPRPRVVSLLQWDPPAGGRIFLRQERALLMSLETRSTLPEGQHGGMGIIYTAAHAESLRGLTFEVPAADGLDVAVVGRDGIGLPRSVQKSVDAAGVRTWDVAGQDAMLEAIVTESAVPLGALATVVDWAGEHRAPEASVSWERRPAVTRAVPGGRVVEEFVTVGPDALPGIVARPEDAPRSALLLLAGSSEPMDGPSGMWSWASRRLAVEEGTFSLRFDRSGVGDAADFDELTQPFSFSRAMLQDVADAVGYLTRASGRTPVAAGLCSGGYFLLMTIVAQQLARVCALNVLSWAPEIEDVPPFANEITSPEDLEVVEERNEHSLKRRLRTWAKTHMPYVVWEQLGSVLHFNVPGPLLTRASRQTEVVLAFSRLDWGAFRLQRGEEAVRRAQAAGGRLTTTLEFRMDHSLLDPLARAAVLPILRNLVRD